MRFTPEIDRNYKSGLGLKELKKPHMVLSIQCPSP